MMHRGYIKLWRKSIDSAVWADINLWRTWCCCLMLANHKEKWVSVDRLLKPVLVKKSEFVTGRYSFHKAMYPKKRKANPSSVTVWRWLLCLQTLGNLSIETNSKYSLIKIVNWDVYQGDNKSFEQRDEQVVNNKRTTNEQVVNTNKNVKNTTSTKSRSAGTFKFINPKLLKRVGTRWPKCYQWIQKCLNHKKNKNAILHVLNRIDQTKNINDFYGFVTKILKVENGNYHEQEFRTIEAEKQQQELKQHLESIGEKI